jgi:rhodanese-related sulfurtransferase/DNA-binding transcriptional ArsR family regulator
MGDRAAKDALFEEFAAVGKALAAPKRLELLDLLAQGERSVQDLAGAAGVGLSTCSAHLQALRTAGLVRTRRQGTWVFYSLAGPGVAALFDSLRRVAQTHRPQTEAARRAFIGPDDVEEVEREELMRRVAEGAVVVLDVRPRAEYDGGHLPGAVHIPLEDLAARIAELPDDREVVAYCRGTYCVLATEAARLLRARGRRAKRSRDGILEWRLAGVRLDAAS